MYVEWGIEMKIANLARDTQGKNAGGFPARTFAYLKNARRGVQFYFHPVGMFLGRVLRP